MTSRRNMKKMKASAMAILAAATMLLSGCGTIIKEEEVVLDIPEYSLENLPDGTFLKVEDTFYTPYNAGKTYSQIAMNSTPDRVLWYTNEKQHIPTYRNGNQIVYKDSGTIPQQFSLEGFEHVCDSVGIRGITLNENGRYTLLRASIKAGSDADVQLDKYSGTIVLDNIDGNTVNSTMINRTGSISGMELGKTYTIGFYIGTKYYECNIMADTEIYASKSITTLNQYELTKNGYLILQMPDLLTPGYYDLNCNGVVYYTGILNTENTSESEKQ